MTTTFAAPPAAPARPLFAVLFDRLNPDYGAPADVRDPADQQVIRDREQALALGTRAAVADRRENDPHPIVALAGQDYRAADAIRAARGLERIPA